MNECPLPIGDYPAIQLGHGSGGKLMHQLLERLIIPAFTNGTPLQRHDGAVFTMGGARLAFTTDSYVVHPLIFPGGDIGQLAIHGTVNDLAMCGARPEFLSCGLILEEGLPTETLKRILDSMHQAAHACGVKIVTGDTKVVDKGKADGLFINTAGIGLVQTPDEISPSRVRPGDAVLVSGDLGRHGIAIMAVREGLSFESTIKSDTAPLWGMVESLLKAGVEVHCLRDLTRGGLTSALNEIAEAAQVHIQVEETAVPVHPEVRGACEILGLDPLYVANEGRFCAFVKASEADRAVEILRNHAEGREAVRVGTVDVHPAGLGRVTMKTALGSTRILDMLSGEQLPRIC